MLHPAKKEPSTKKKKSPGATHTDDPGGAGVDGGPVIRELPSVGQGREITQSSPRHCHCLGFLFVWFSPNPRVAPSGWRPAAPAGLTAALHPLGPRVPVPPWGLARGRRRDPSPCRAAGSERASRSGVRLTVMRGMFFLPW